MMRYMPFVAAALLASVLPALAQSTDRVSIGGVVRNDRVSLEGSQHANLPVTGVSGEFRISRYVGVEGELTIARGEVTRTYEGDFLSYADAGASREEILRQAVFARRTTVNTAGMGGGGAITFHTDSGRRVEGVLRAGVSYRQYRYTDTIRVTRVPPGVTFEQAQAHFHDQQTKRGRGGLLIGLTVPVRVFAELYAAPELRWVWGGPARIGDNYDEGSAGIRMIWKM